MFLVMYVGAYTKAQMIVPDSSNSILTESNEQVVNTDTIEDPLRDGAYTVINSTSWEQISGIVGVDDKIGSHLNAQHKTLTIVKTAINYALGILSLIALVYLLYNGFMMVTAAGDDNQYKKGIKWIRYAAIALVGVGASRLIISVIFWFINVIITN